MTITTHFATTRGNPRDDRTILVFATSRVGFDRGTAIEAAIVAVTAYAIDDRPAGCDEAEPLAWTLHDLTEEERRSVRESAVEIAQARLAVQRSAAVEMRSDVARGAA